MKKGRSASVKKDTRNKSASRTRRDSVKPDKETPPPKTAEKKPPASKQTAVTATSNFYKTQQSSGGDNVRVAVRIRPLMKHELDGGTEIT